ncbi:VOC family protein [Humibacter ginsengisoli]
MSENTTTERVTAANGPHTTNGMPHGSTSITPHIVVHDAAEALDFYRDVFGARVLDVTRLPGGDGIAHAVVDFGNGMLTLSDPLESVGLVALDDPERRPYSLAVYVTDCDAVTDAAASAGATVREQPATFVTGDRYSSILDPFGVRWAVMTRVEDLSFEESAARVAAWAQEQS